MMMQRRDRYSWRDHSRRIEDGVSAILLVAIIAGIVAFCDFGLAASAHFDNHNAMTDGNVRITRLFSITGQSDADRKQLATSLLIEAANGLETDVTGLHRSEKQQDAVLDSLRATAQTGQPPALDTMRLTYYSFLHKTVPIIILSMLTVVMGGTMLVYAFETDAASYRTSEFLIDFEWKRVWPIFFVLLTLLPFGWLFYGVSAIRFAWFLRKEKQRTPAPDAHEEAFQHFTRHDVDLCADRNQRPRALPVFHSAPKAARTLYAQLRLDAGHRRIVKQLESAREIREEAEEQLEYYGELIKQKQAVRREALADERKFGAINLDEQLIASTEQLQAEFERMMSFPGVTRVRVINDQISLFVEARTEWDGRMFDLGDWELRFGNNGRIYSRELRSGVQKNWHGGYPVYRNGDDGFCFGNQRGVIDEHLLKGQFLEAIEVAVNSLRSINERDMPYIQEAFYEVETVDDEHLSPVR